MVEANRHPLTAAPDFSNVVVRSGRHYCPAWRVRETNLFNPEI